MKTLVVLAGILALALTAPALAAHPGSDAKCESCHAVGKGDAKAPKVMPQPPGFFARLLGQKAVVGHPSVSCAGTVRPDGTISGCHRPEEGRKGFLVVEIAERAVDGFCVRCHGELGEPGAHHPSYKAVREGEDTRDAFVRPAAGQEVYTDFSPAVRGEPWASYPDSLVLTALPGGAKRLEVVLPLAAVTELDSAGQPVVHEHVVTCSTCHNPHYGYLVEVGSEEQLNQEQVARPKGDALLRLRDYNNALCEACH